MKDNWNGFKTEPTREITDHQANQMGCDRYGIDGWAYFKKEWERVTSSIDALTTKPKRKKSGA